MLKYIGYEVWVSQSAPNLLALLPPAESGDVPSRFMACHGTNEIAASGSTFMIPDENCLQYVSHLLHGAMAKG